MDGPFFRDHPGEPVPEENCWTLWCKGRLTEADTPTIQLGATPSGLTSAHIHHPPYFLQARCPSCCPTNSIKALKDPSSKIIHRCHLLLILQKGTSSFLYARSPMPEPHTYRLTELRFKVPLNTKQVISETFPKPISWLGMENYT